MVDIVIPREDRRQWIPFALDIKNNLLGRIGIALYKPDQSDQFQVMEVGDIEFEFNGIQWIIAGGANVIPAAVMPINNPRFRRKLKRLGWTRCECGEEIDWYSAYFNYIAEEPLIKCCFCLNPSLKR